MTATASDPRVDTVDARVYTIPTDGPEADGTLSWDSTTVVIVVAEAGGRAGLGWTYASAAAAAVVGDMLGDVVVGRPALDPPGATEAMQRAVRNIGRSGVAATAISAVDIALWDLKAKLLGVPLVRLLGQVHDKIEIYGSGGFTTYDDSQTAEQVGSWIEHAGVEKVKIKVGESWGSRPDRDLARAGFVRDLIGSRDLFVDANGGYAVGQAVRIGRAYDDLGVMWFEEPVSSDDLAGLRTVRERVAADVAAGEYGYDITHFRGLVTSGAVDCVQIDATRCGGVTEFMRAAAYVASHNTQVSAHCAPHLHASFVAAVPNARHIEYFHDHVRIEEQLLFDGARTPVHGHLVPNLDDAGHGISLRADAERWRVS